MKVAALFARVFSDQQQNEMIASQLAAWQEYAAHEY
jgi:hypothetical protein